MTAVKIQVEPFQAKHNRQSLFVYLPRSVFRIRSEFVTRRQSGDGIPWDNVHHSSTQTTWEASTDNSIRNSAPSICTRIFTGGAESRDLRGSYFWLSSVAKMDPRYSSAVLSCSPVSESCSVWCTCCLLAIFFGGGFALLHSDCKWPVKWQLKHSESLYLHLSGVWMVAQFAEIVFHARRDIDPPSDRITTCCRTWPVWATASSAASWKVKLPDNNSPTNFTPVSDLQYEIGISARLLSEWTCNDHAALFFV